MDVNDKIRYFISQAKAEGTSVVLLTSGGTTVPLESHTVRFIDNFSSGSRGSASAEYFLYHGYRVLFLHRHKSMKPFERNFYRINMADILSLQDGQPAVNPKSSDLCKKYLESMGRYSDAMLFVEFTSVTEYLTLLEHCCKELAQLGKNATVYLAAAVSDFYIPDHELPEHKIQSSAPIQLKLQLVPKQLKALVNNWIPQAYVISFKLETDPNLIIPKSHKALETYKHQMVIANILETRREVVWLVRKEDDAPIEIRLSEDELKGGVEIEKHIVERIVRLHKEASIADN